MPTRDQLVELMVTSLQHSQRSAISSPDACQASGLLFSGHVHHARVVRLDADGERETLAVRLADSGASTGDSGRASADWPVSVLPSDVVPDPESLEWLGMPAP
jgi:hypothetical protein